jgi:4-hydroxy-tetrahydrodipicolinate reductase
MHQVEPRFLAKGVIESSQYNSWTLEDADDQIHIEAKRIGTVPGTHTVTMILMLTVMKSTYSSQPRGICNAISRMDYRKRVFTMKDVLEL